MIEMLPNPVPIPLLLMTSSPLVQAFTPAEKEGLSKFKSDYLERALQEAASQTSSTIPSLEIWGVSMAEEDPRRDVIIVKFLRAKYLPSKRKLIKVNLSSQRRTLSLSRL